MSVCMYACMYICVYLYTYVLIDVVFIYVLYRYLDGSRVKTRATPSAQAVAMSPSASAATDHTDPPAHVSIRQHATADDSIRQHTSAAPPLTTPTRQ